MPNVLKSSDNYWTFKFCLVSFISLGAVATEQANKTCQDLSCKIYLFTFKKLAGI